MNTRKGQPIYISGIRVCLAKFLLEDFKPYYESWSETETQRNFNFRHDWASYEEFLAFFTNPKRPPQRLNCSILRMVDGIPVGRLSLAPEHLEPDLGIWIYESFRSQGYGTEAVSLAVEYIFNNFDLDYIVAGIYEHNHPSMRLFEKVGFKRAPELDQEENSVFGGEKTTQLCYRIDGPKGNG